MSSSMGTTNSTEVLALSLLPFDEAKGIQIGQYVLAGTLGALIWDLLTHVLYDIRLLRKNKIRLTTLVYFASRAAALANVLGCTIFQTAPVKHCEALQLFDGITYALAVSLTSLLFFFRIRAVFARNNLIILIFFILWLSVAATSITPLFDFRAQNIPGTPYCINNSSRIFASSTIFTSFVHDTLVFVAITSKLVMYSYVDTDAELELRGEGKGNGRGEIWRRKWKWVFGRKNLPTITKTVLEDGQIYYIIAVCANTVVLAMIFAKGLPPTYREMLAETYVFVTNSIACYVYRHTRDIFYKPSSGTTLRTTSRFGFSTNDRHYRAGPGSETETGTGSGSGSIPVPLQVRVRAPQSNGHELPTLSVTDNFDRKDDIEHIRGDGLSAMENANSIVIHKTIDIDIDIGSGKDSSSVESLDNSNSDKYRAER